MEIISKKEFNKRFVNGEQYIELTKTGEVVDIDKNYYWESRNVYNQLKLIVDTYNNKLNEDQIYGDNGLVELLIPYQKAYNNLKNKQQEHLNRLITGVICVEDGSVDIDELSEEGPAPGKVLVYRQGAKAPTFEYTTPLINDFINLDEHYVRQMWDIAEKFTSSTSKYFTIKPSKYSTYGIKTGGPEILDEAIEYVNIYLQHFNEGDMILSYYSSKLDMSDIKFSSFITVIGDVTLSQALINYYEDDYIVVNNIENSFIKFTRKNKND